MIISSGRNYIFVHIPKTGGTSMALALEGRALKDDILIGDTPKAVRRRKRLSNVKSAGRLWKHSTMADIGGLVPAEQMQRAFTFTLIRNPWDRMVSYYHWLRNQSFDHPAVSLAKHRDFSGFLNAPETEVALKAQPYASYMINQDGVEICSAYIRLEHLEDDAAPLWEHLGFALELPNTNQSDRERDYQDYFTSRDRQLVARICDMDIQRFGYQYS